MKKLMTMIAAVGMAFGLFAETDLPSSTSFESASEFTDGKLSVGDGTKWTCADYDAATLSQTEYEDGEAYLYSNTTRYPAFETDQDYYLTIKTAFDKPLNRSFTDAYAGDDAPVFIDQLVKFTAADEDMEIADTSAKIGVWAREIYGADGETVTGTKLFVTAGPVVDSKPTIYDLGTIDVEAWHRLTIKAIKAKSSELGYEIFVDGIALEADKAGYASAEGLSIEAQALNAAKKIFPAMVGGLGVASLGVAGQGAIDDMMTTVTSPGTWADTKSITLDFDDSEVTKLVYTAFGSEGSVERTTATSVTLPYITGMTLSIDLTKTECTGEYQVEDVTSAGGATFDKETGAIGNLVENDTIYIKTKDYARRIKIGDKYYANFADAIAAIGDVAAGQTVTVELADAVNVAWDDTEGTEANFDAGEGEIVIDLKGQTITGTAEDATEDGYVLMCNGNVKIVDTGVGGKIVANENYAGAVDQLTGALTIEGGIFDGKVLAEDATISIFRGQFLKAANKTEAGEFTLAEFVDEGSDLTDNGTYFLVTVAPQYEVSFWDGETEYTALRATVKSGSKVTKPADPEKTGYTFKAWQKDGVDFNFDTAIVEDTELKATWTANEYTISIANGGDDATATPAVYTYNVATDVTLDAGTKAGYEVDTWTAPAGCTITGNTLTIPAGVSGDLTATVTWKATTYTITAVNGSADPATYTIDDVAGDDGLSVELEANDPEDGKKFKEWTIVTDPVGADVTIDDTTESVAVMTIAKGVLANITVTATYEDEGGVPVDPTDPPATEDGEENLALLNSLLGENAAKWAADVYGEGGSVPGSKLDDSTPELIAAAAEYNLKVMASPVTITPAATTDGKFTFALSDADKANPVVAATLAQELMVYTSDLKVDFARDAEGAAVEAEVSGDLIEVGFTGEDLEGETANAGFMKVDLTVED